MRHRTTHPIAASALIAIVLLLAFWSIALAEQAGPGGQPPAVKKPAETEFAPRGQRETRDIKYGDWRKVCFQTPGTKMVCRTSISGTWETGQSAVRADLIERDGDSAARLQLFLPVGLYLPAAVGLWISTVYLRFHYGIDVIAGALLAGLALGVAFAVAHRTRASIEVTPP